MAATPEFPERPLDESRLRRLGQALWSHRWWWLGPLLIVAGALVVMRILYLWAPPSPFIYRFE